jgi:hypothetical protein
MAKGQQKPSKEKKKPKAEVKAKAPSAYKQGYGGSGPSAVTSAMMPKKS